MSASPTFLSRMVAIGLLAAGLCAALTLDMPVVNDLVFRVATLIILGTSWNLMANSGLVSLGHSAYWGVGCYACVLFANRAGFPLTLGLLSAMIAGSIVGTVLVFATTRLGGFSFAVATLGLSETLRVCALMLTDVTGGAVGVFVAEPVRPNLKLLFFVTLGLAIVCVLIADWLSRSRYHYAWRAMRNQEAAAQMLGIDPRPYRYAIVALAGAMAATGGALTSLYTGYLDPAISFSLRITIESQIAPIIGGMYTVAGPVVGAFAIVGLSELTRVTFGANEGVGQLIFGALLVASILVMPMGIYGLWTGKRPTLFAKLRAARRGGAAQARGPLDESVP
jgi:branched-chain amino acid transport system permease protein